jgi:hypothetical protein
MLLFVNKKRLPSPAIYRGGDNAPLQLVRQRLAVPVAAVLCLALAFVRTFAQSTLIDALRLLSVASGSLIRLCVDRVAERVTAPIVIIDWLTHPHLP